MLCRCTINFKISILIILKMKNKVNIIIISISIVAVGIVYLFVNFRNDMLALKGPSYNKDTCNYGLSIFKPNIRDSIICQESYSYKGDSISIYMFQKLAGIAIVKNHNFTEESVRNIIYSGYPKDFLNLTPLGLRACIWNESNFISFNPNYGGGHYLVFKLGPSTSLSEIMSEKESRQFIVKGSFMSISGMDNNSFLNLTIDKVKPKTTLIFRSFNHSIDLVIIMQDNNDNSDYENELLIME